MRLPLLNLRLILLASLLIWGCGKANDSVVTVDSSGKHPTGWVTVHSGSYLQDATTCKGCHGASLTGGISGVSCSSSSFNGMSCHAGGPHPLPWPAHNNSSNQQAACSPCHGAGLGGGVNAPACTQCHKQLLSGNVPLLGTCISCHGNPPNGAAFPNISAAHRAHTAVTLSCSACHSGGGSGTATHGQTLIVAFSAVYNAKTGTAVMNSDGSCANVSCHGGKVSPRWRGGRIDPFTDCTTCHETGTAAGMPQTNSFYSGDHQKHLGEIGMLCIDCHDMAVVAGSAAHFSGLDTPAFELAAARTMRAALNFNSGARSCTPGSTPPAGSFSIGVCHAAQNW